MFPMNVRAQGSNPDIQKAGKTKKLGMYLQDPSLPKIHENYHFPLQSDFLRGSGSSRVIIRNTNAFGQPVDPGLNWENAKDLSFEHFADEGLADNPQFHQINVFAVLNRALDLIEEEVGHNIVWKDGAPLIVRPHAFNGANAYYDPSESSLNFGFFDTPFRRSYVWTCLSHDIITHELGHAVFDTFRPLYLYSTSPDAGALHESFGDLMAMFSALSSPLLVKHLYRETQGNMRDPSLISRLAEEFGQGLFGFGTPYLRSALETVKYYAADYAPHARSVVWTGAIYEILERLVKVSHPKGFGQNAAGFTEFSEALVDASRWVKGMLLRALHYTPPNDLTMPLLARLMYEADAHVYPDDNQFREIAKAVFIDREIWQDDLNLQVDRAIGQDFRGFTDADPTTLACIIMRHAEALQLPPGAVRLVNPRLVTTTRQIDKVQAGKSSQIKTITEHYLEYTYEQAETIIDFSTGEPVPLTFYGGGTLVMDEDWNATLLATFPIRYVPREPTGEGGRGGRRGARTELDNAHGAQIQQLLAARQGKADADKVSVPGCAFSLERSGLGGYRLVRHRCNLHDRAMGQSLTKHGIVQS
jgi:hypothetical protein